MLCPQILSVLKCYVREAYRTHVTVGLFCRGATDSVIRERISRRIRDSAAVTVA